MPDRTQILANLSLIANQGVAFALAWHVALAGVLVAVLAGWRPSRRLAAALCAAPIASVSAFAWIYGNPLNGVVFAALAIVLVLLALLRGERGPVTEGPAWSMIGGGLLIAFGWCYPHFLVDRSPAWYAIAAPLGLVPCPTLAAICGVALVADGFANRAWTATLAAVSVLYALFGTVRLGVLLDVALLAGAAAALALVITSRPGAAASANSRAARHSGRFLRENRPTR